MSQTKRFRNIETNLHCTLIEEQHDKVSKMSHNKPCFWLFLETNDGTIWHPSAPENPPKFSHYKHEAYTSIRTMVAILAAHLNSSQSCRGRTIDSPKFDRYHPLRNRCRNISTSVGHCFGVCGVISRLGLFVFVGRMDHLCSSCVWGYLNSLLDQCCFY